MTYKKNELIDQDYAKEHFTKEPHCFKLPVEGFFLHENISGIGHGTWTVFFVEADGDETDICRVITVGELDNVLRLLKANLASVQAIWEIRDNVLHERGPMAEAGFDSDKINAVLGVIDNATSGLDALDARCTCGCNVFRKPDPTDAKLFVCNSCGARWRGE